jgi:hypothetical protein
MWNKVFSSQDDLDTIKSMLEDLDVFEDEFDIRTDYSGRGMYGKECIGFVTKEAALIPMALTAVLIDTERYALLDNNIAWSDLTDIRTDSMGLSTIVYFPDWQLDKDEDNS